jgi:hypothetical protein
MLWNLVRNNAVAGAGLAVLAIGAMPAPASAQGYGYGGYDAPSAVVVECGPGQRAVMERANGRIVARCVGQARRPVIYDDGYGVPQRSAYDTYRPARRTVYQERYSRRRSTSKSVLGIAGSAATGAGIGGIVGGKKGALIGAAIGGGGASIYESAKRR